MNITVIKNEAEYQLILTEIDKLMNAELNTAEGELLNNLVSLVEEYESKEFVIKKPSFWSLMMFQLDNKKITLSNVIAYFKVDIRLILNNTLRYFHLG